MSENADELYDLGCNYYHGKNGYPLNYTKALNCFMQAAEAGHSGAMDYLGVMYENGKNVNENSQTAAVWYYKAIQANSQNAYALYHLGRLYYSGNGVQQDMNMAFELLDASISVQFANKQALIPDSLFIAGMIMAEHYHNKKKAVPYFLEASEAGNIPEAWYDLGWLCEQGAMDIPKSSIPGTACSYYKEAAKLGMVESMDSVGRLYASVQMFDEARYWVGKAAAEGYGPAIKRLKLLNRL